MRRRPTPFRLPVLVQDTLLALLVTAMQIQGTLAKPAETESRPLSELGFLGYGLLALSGLALVVRRRYPVPVFLATPLAALAADKEKEKDSKKPYPLETCVVSGEKLGEMGKPVVHDYKGREVKFCCKDCIKDFNKDPDKYIKKLDEAEAKAKEKK